MIHPHTELRFISQEKGYGVVATQFIPKGTITWAMDKLDRIYTPEEVRRMDMPYQAVLEKYCYRDGNGDWILCWDISRYVNHSFNSNCISTGSMITFNTEDAKTGRAWYLPSSAATNTVLVIFHEWWGLNDYIKREAQRWQDSLGNVDIYAVDLYDGKIATSPEEASKLASSLDNTRTDAIIKGLLLRAGRDKAIGTLGWCLGGGYAFRASVLAGNQAAGCVMYYGFPEADGRRIKPLQTDVLYVWGSKDTFITHEKVAALQTGVTGLGRKFQWETYNAAHAFANPSNPNFDAGAASDAMAKSLKFLRYHMALN